MEKIMAEVPNKTQRPKINPFFRRERSFVLPMNSAQNPSSEPHMRRERSFVKDTSRYNQGNFLHQNRRQGQQITQIKAKPTMELYKPPSVRDTDIPVNVAKNGRVHFHASEPPRITKSKTSLELFHPKASATAAPPGVQVIQLVPLSGLLSESTLKRSKSVGSHADMQLHGDSGDLKWAKWTPEAESTLKKAVQDPEKASARVLMDAVRIILTKAVESSQYAVPAARLCITIIEREKRETFLESLLNTCQEWYRERDRLLRTSASSSVASKNASNATSAPRWLGFIAFLNEMYLQLKRRQLHLTTQCDGVPPCLMLLSLLAECCHTGLQPQANYSSAEVEKLFFVLMAIGRDLEQEIPAKMAIVMNGVRDAFLAQATPPNVKKTLLQLVELQGARWQLPAQALMYYHPSSGNFGN